MSSSSDRIQAAGGELTLWAVLREDVYETEFGDGWYLHVHGVALQEEDAYRLAALGGTSRLVKWHVRSYRLGLRNDLPFLLDPRKPEEEFTAGHLVAILAEIPPGKSASRLLLGAGRREDGPFAILAD
jgi:hypothetical protein